MVGIFRGALTGVILFAASLPLMATAPDERYIITFVPGTEQSVRGAINAGGGGVKRALANRHLLSATLPPGLLRALQARGDVIAVEVDPKRFPQMEPQETPYGIPMVQAFDPDAGTGLTESATPRKVCIMDTGYDLGHQDLPTVGVTGDDDCGPACGSSGNWFEDGYGHGTHVSGTIAGLNNGYGVVGVNSSGALPIHMVKVFDQQGGWAYGSDLIAAIDQCVVAGAYVVNMSLGGGGSSVAEEAAFASAHDGTHADLGPGQTVLFIASAGNSGNNSLSYPASYDSVMSVAAIDDTEGAASFSQYNSQVEIAGPGVGVMSTLPADTYAAWDGTSMASPHVAGVAALVWGYHNSCSAAQIRTALMAGAKDLGGPGRDASYGYGLVQAMATKSELDSSCSVAGPSNEGYVAEQLTNASQKMVGSASVPPNTAIIADEYQYSIDVPLGASDLRIQTYDAYPGSGGGAGDADLYVLAPNASDDYPAPDVWDCRPYINGNSETCVEDSPVDGTWRVMLRAFTGFADVAVKASFTPSGAPVTQYYAPDADLPVKGTVSPSYADLAYNDGVLQTITEVTSGGKPANRTSIAEHQWRIPGVSNGTSVTLQLVAAVTDQGEEDTIAFDVSYNGGGWHPLCLAPPECDLRTGGALQFYEVALPSFTPGTVIVRARDNDRTAKNLANNVLYLDQLNVVTVEPTAGPPPPPPPPATELVLSATGEKRKKGKIWVTLDWTTPSNVTVKRSINGSPMSSIALGVTAGTFEDGTGLKGSPTLSYQVCDSSNPLVCSDAVTVTF